MYTSGNPNHTGTRDNYLEYIDTLPLANTPEVFGLHTNAEIGYFTRATKDLWIQLIELQPQTGEAGTGISREEFIGNLASDIEVGEIHIPYCGELFREKLFTIQRGQTQVDSGITHCPM